MANTNLKNGALEAAKAARASQLSATGRLPVSQLFAIDGLTAVCTGATGSIGKEMCVTLAEAGCNIVSIQLPNDAAALSLQEDVIALGKNFTAFECDVGCSRDLRQCFEEIWATGMQADILLNAAGINQRGGTKSLTDADVDAVSRMISNTKPSQATRNRH